MNLGDLDQRIHDDKYPRDSNPVRIATGKRTRNLSEPTDSADDSRGILPRQALLSSMIIPEVIRA